MYINNPTKEQLAVWFNCREKMADYLIMKLGAFLVHKKDENYYFVNSQDFKSKLKRVPFWVKLVDNL